GRLTIPTHEQTVWCPSQETNVFQRLENHPAGIPLETRQTGRIDKGELRARHFQKDTLEFLNGFFNARCHRVHGLVSFSRCDVFWGVQIPLATTVPRSVRAKFADRLGNAAARSLMGA